MNATMETQRPFMSNLSRNCGEAHLMKSGICANLDSKSWVIGLRGGKLLGWIMWKLSNGILYSMSHDEAESFMKIQNDAIFRVAEILGIELEPDDENTRGKYNA